VFNSPVSAQLVWPSTVAVIQTNTTYLLSEFGVSIPASKPIGISFPSRYSNGAGGAAFACFLSSGASDAWDGTVPATFSHELGHLLLDGDGHTPSDSANLMYPVSENTLGPSIKCRMSQAQRELFRHQSSHLSSVPDPYLATSECIVVPSPVQ